MNDETHPVSMIIYLNLIECLVCIDVIMVMECYGGCGMLQKRESPTFKFACAMYVRPIMIED